MHANHTREVINFFHSISTGPAVSMAPADNSYRGSGGAHNKFRPTRAARKSKRKAQRLARKVA